MDYAMKGTDSGSLSILLFSFIICVLACVSVCYAVFSHVKNVSFSSSILTFSTNASSYYKESNHFNKNPNYSFYQFNLANVKSSIFIYLSTYHTGTTTKETCKKQIG